MSSKDVHAEVFEQKLSLEAPHNLPLFKPRAKGTINYCLTAPA